MNIIRFYNQNRKKVWRVIIIILLIFVVLRLLNYYSIIRNNNTLSNTNTEITGNSIENRTDTYTSNTSGVTGTAIDEKDLSKVQDVLDSFFKMCNSQDYEGAYNLLTDECKENIYPTLKSFKNNYYDNIFQGKQKVYTFENWYLDTYYVTIKDDALSTGKISSVEETLYDYITVKDEKLNISTYIGRTNMGQEENLQNINMKINSKDTFMDYEIYNVTIKNNSDKTICLTTGDSSNDVYIEDSNSIKYGVYNHELIKSQMIVQAGYTKTLSFKFYSSNISTKKIQRMSFKNLILDYESYQNGDTQNNLYQYYINLNMQ